MSRIPASLTRAVVRRADGRCEYCQLSQEGQEATFHVDHVVPLAIGGPTTLENLALACVSCSLRKGARQNAADPVDGTAVRLFDPRSQAWSTHFVWDGALATGITAIGRATVVALAMNRPIAVEIRGEEAVLGRHPGTLRLADQSSDRPQLAPQVQVCRPTRSGNASGETTRSGPQTPTGSRLDHYPEGTNSDLPSRLCSTAVRPQA